MLGGITGNCVLAFVLFFSGSVRAQDAGKFTRLFSYLRADCELVMIVDVDQLTKVYDEATTWIQNTPAVAQCPALKAEVEKGKNQLDAKFEEIKQKYFLDVTKDVHALAIGVKVSERGEHGFMIALQGSFSERLPAGIAQDAQPETIEGHEVYLNEPDGPVMITKDGDVLVFADPDSMQIVLKSTDTATKLLEKHPDLKSGMSGAQAVKIDMTFAELGKKMADEEELKIISTLLRSLSRVRMQAGDGFGVLLDFSDEKGAERGHFLLKAWREIMIGGSHMYRAYAKLFLGFDIEKTPGLPPAFTEALKNREAVSQTLDEIFPPVQNRPLVVRRGNSVELSASRYMAQGNVLVLGIVSSVAIPIFVAYIRRSKQTAAGLVVSDVKAALDMFRLDFRRYPTTSEGLEILVDKGLLKELPKDAYGGPVLYFSESKDSYLLKLLGADGRPGGEGENKDVIIKSD